MRIRRSSWDPWSEGGLDHPLREVTAVTLHRFTVRPKEDNMEQELVRMVAEKTGLSEDKARMAAETVIGYLKDKLPAPISSQLDSAASGGGNLGKMAEGLGGGFGGRE
jgi:hypothetical protein